MKSFREILAESKYKIPYKRKDVKQMSGWEWGLGGEQKGKTISPKAKKLNDKLIMLCDDAFKKLNKNNKNDIVNKVINDFKEFRNKDEYFKGAYQDKIAADIIENIFDKDDWF